MTHVAGAFRIRLQAAGRVGMLHRFFDAEKDGPGGEQPFLDAHGLGKRIVVAFRRGAHQAEQRAPIHHAAASQRAGITVAHENLVGRNQHVTGLIDASASGPSKHLQNFIGAQRLFGVIAAIRFTGQRHAPEREIDAGSKAHGRDHDAKLARFRQWFDDAGARAIAQAAVMVNDAAFEHLCQMFANKLFLLRGDLKRIRCWQVPRKFGGQ